ncbi:MAG: FAD-dependent oxidoreductase [Burkholderiaceae bacterium]
MRIGIAGAGLAGRLAAWRLVLAGHDVTVFDPADGPERGPVRFAGPEARADDPAIAPAAGWTAAGMLSPIAELETADAEVFALGLRSLDLWQRYEAQLSGPIGLRRAGSLMLAYGSDAGAARRVVDALTARAPAAHRPEPITLERLRTLEPDIHGPALAWELAGEGQVDAVLAMRALADAGAARGVRFRWGVRAAPGDGWIDVEPPAGADAPADAGRHRFDHVIDARGVGARPDLPVRGVRGEIFWLHAPGVRLGRPLRLLHPRHRVYLVPRDGDRIVVGASEIESEDRSAPSLRSTVELLAAAHSVMPALAEARVIRQDVNLRPAMPDNLPVISHRAASTAINGLFRHGWLIAPALVEKALGALIGFPHD